jgi:hypothetical protein
MSKMHVFNKHGSFFHRFVNITLGELNKKNHIFGHLMVFISLFLRHPTEPFWWAMTPTAGQPITVQGLVVEAYSLLLMFP